MYNPPSKEKWRSTGYFSDSYKEYYDLGYKHCENKIAYSEPFESSNHERDTSYTDEINYWYYVGYFDYIITEN